MAKKYEFATRLKELAEQVLTDKKFALVSGYTSKRERLCRVYIRTSDCTLNELSRLYSDADKFFEASALEQRMAVSLIQAMHYHFNLDYARKEVTSLLKVIKAHEPITVKALQKAMGHETESYARIIFETGLNWGFIEHNANLDKFVVGSNPILKEIEVKCREAAWKTTSNIGGSAMNANRHIKQVINGRAYNTATARFIGRGEFEGVNVELYINRFGEPFIIEEVNSPPFKRSTRLILPDADKFRSIVSVISPQMIEELSVEANTEARVALRLPCATHKSAKAAAKKAGLSLNTWLTRVIQEAL